jgi:hypothetical protein
MNAVCIDFDVVIRFLVIAAGPVNGYYLISDANCTVRFDQRDHLW